MKRSVVFLLLVALLLGTVACAGTTTDSDPTDAEDSAITTSTTETTAVQDDTTTTVTTVSSTVTVSSQQSKAPLAVSKRTFAPATQTQDALTTQNPERGWRTHIYWDVGLSLDRDRLIKHSAQYNARWEDRYQYWDAQYKTFFNTRGNHVSTAFTYIYLTDWYDDPVLPQEALECIEEFFEYVREKKFTMLLSFCYCDSARDTTTCASEGVMISHMAQLAPLVRRNRDVIHCIKNGFIGAYGEWAYQSPVVDKRNIINAIMKFLCEPSGLPFLIRLPEYKNLIGTESEFYNKIGFANDAIYGEQTRKGWNSAGFQYGMAGWEQVSREGAYFPNDGEMCTNYAMTHYDNLETGGTGIVPYGIEVIAETAHHWFSTMSIWHGYCDYNSRLDPVRIMDTWKEQAVTPQLLEEYDVVYDPAWFTDQNGNTVQRNCFEFLRDHLGYKIVLQDVSVTDVGKVTLRLKNYGMSAAFRMHSGFVVLDEDYNVVSGVSAGDPETWYSHDPENWQDTTVLEHTIEATIKKPTKRGRYHIAFYLKNELNIFARMSNRMDVAGGYQILHSFDI